MAAGVLCDEIWVIMRAFKVAIMYLGLKGFREYFLLIWAQCIDVMVLGAFGIDYMIPRRFP